MKQKQTKHYVEDEQKFYWDIASEDYALQGNNYLNVYESGSWCFNSKSEINGAKTKFTEKEYNKICEQSNIPKQLFKKERVDDNE